MTKAVHSTDAQNLTIQLYGQGGENTGLVEVHQPNTGLVTNICGGTWGRREATVVCREMGFAGSVFSYNFHFYLTINKFKACLFMLLT